MSRQDELNRLMQLATTLEQSEEVISRRDKIDRRAQLYHLDYRYTPPRGVLKAIDPAPQYVGQRAEDKLCAQDFTLTCRADADQMLAEWAVENTLADADPEQRKQAEQDIKKRARDLADKKEAAARGLLWRIEAQQEADVTRALAHSAAVYGFAGPVRLGYDDEAEAEPGVVPLYVQFLDPRSILIKPGNRAGRGPEVVIYKRKASADRLRYEGWTLDEKDGAEKATSENSAVMSEYTIYDCWEKRRKKSGKGYKLELWHSIILDGPGGQRFLLPPINKAAKGCVRIPYVFVPVRPATFLHEDYPGDSSTSFLDAFDPNWELACLNLSMQAQMVQLAVNPPTLQKTEDPQEIDTVTPGAQNQVRPNEDAEIMENPWARQEIAALSNMLQMSFQKSTFTAPTYGEGNTQTSGLQTARLQQSSEEGLGATRGAVEQALEQVFNLIAMFGKGYLGKQAYSVPDAAGMAIQVAGELFDGNELFEVHLPGMTKFEQAQMAMSWRSLADTRPDGSKFISDETAREMSNVTPWEHVENYRIRWERMMDLKYEEMKTARLARATQREENVKDMFAMEQAKMKLMAQQQAMMAEQQKFQNEQQRAAGVPPQEPNQPQQRGVAASPLAESAPSEQQYSFDPGV